MIATFSNLFSSSFFRIAPTRPSIMSDGATKSAPARACDNACSLKISSVASFTTSPCLNHPAMPVVRVLAQAHVRNHQQIQFRFLDPFDRPLHHAIFRQRTRSPRIFASPAIRTESPRISPAIPLPGILPQSDPPTVGRLPGIELISFAHFRSGANEHRINKSRRVQPMFPHQIPQLLCAPQTPRPMQWKTHSGFAPAGNFVRSPENIPSKPQCTASTVVSSRHHHALHLCLAQRFLRYRPDCRKQRPPRKLQKFRHSPKHLPNGAQPTD